MSMDRSFLFFLTICLLCVSFIHSVPLNGSCSSTSNCDGNNTLVCRDGRCQCNKPWYRPCGASCEVNPNIAYEGQQCMVNDNCVTNMVCLNQRCQCFQNYTAVNGICLKQLNATCSINADCWSTNCTNSRCQCPPGYESQGDKIRCRRKLLKIYNSWLEANQTNQTCSDFSFCMDEFAECVSDLSFLTGRYCKCRTGYRVSDNNERCDIISSPLFSPGDFQPSQHQACGYCPDDNAACIKAENQTTCWCRAGYEKIGDRCEVNRRMNPPIIYPNWNDMGLHDYSDNCTNRYNDTILFNSTNQVESRLCVCAPDYQFMGVDRKCQKIERTWINSVYEYGLCTRINSLDGAFLENGLCPEPLRCEGRQDKYICSCGRGRFRDLDDPTQCVNYIGNGTNPIDPRCPTRNARRNTTSDVCQCDRGYVPVNENRQCQLTLAFEAGMSSCSTDRSNDDVCRQARFGETAFLCRYGECRCPGGQSFINENRTRCNALVNQTLLGPIEDCPPFSTLRSGRCLCFRGYRVSSDFRRCDRLTPQLSEYIDVPTISFNDFNDEDCQFIFSGPVQAYSTDRCQCRANAFFNYANNGCWHLLNTTITEQAVSDFCPPNSAFGAEPKCLCNIGYEIQYRTCVPKVDRLYVENDTLAIVKDGLTLEDCIKWFGTGAKLSDFGRFCVCKPQAYPINFFTYCRFRIDEYTRDIKGLSTCPENTFVRFLNNDDQACSCKPGYNRTSFSETCEILGVPLTGTDYLQGSTCTTINSEDCQGKFGRHAFCRNETCFCNRRLSFINAEGQCEPFSNYIFPGLHERSNHSCRRNEDCGNRVGVTCGYLSYDLTHKVCQCKDGWLLDPKSQLCVDKRCQPGCNSNRNFECQGYNCVCRFGYGYNGTDCVLMNTRLELDQVCNRTAVWTYGVTSVNNNYLQCDFNCERARCIRGYRPDGSRCVPYQLERDQCAYKLGFCSEVSNYSTCNFNDNTCACEAAHYRYGDTCAKAVDSRCVEDEECGGAASCKGSRCRCNDRQRREQASDLYGRPIDRCVNGVDSTSFSTFVFIALTLVWTILA